MQGYTPWKPPVEPEAPPLVPVEPKPTPPPPAPEPEPRPTPPPPVEVKPDPPKVEVIPAPVDAPEPKAAAESPDEPPLPTPTTWPELLVYLVLATGVGSGLPWFMRKIVQFAAVKIVGMVHEKVKDSTIGKATLTPELFEQLKDILPHIQEFAKSIRENQPITGVSSPVYRQALETQLQQHEKALLDIKTRLEGIK